MGNTKSIGAAYSDQDISGSTILGHGVNAASTLGFYGLTPIVQRPYTSSVHLSSEIASSTDFAAGQLAVLNEIQKTLVALGIWATV